MRSDIPNVVDLIWRAAASFSGGLCYLVVRRDLPPRKAVGVIVIAIAFGLFAADWVAQKTGIPGVTAPASARSRHAVSLATETFVCRATRSSGSPLGARNLPGQTRFRNTGYCDPSPHAVVAAVQAIP